MIRLQIYQTWGGINHLVNEIDVSDFTEPQVSEVIVKQESIYPGCWHRLKRYPSAAEAESRMLNFIDQLTS